jgi:hypothetical protein
MICPCKDCENKGCGSYHSQCERYIEYAKWKKRINELERNDKQLKYNIKERRNKWNKKSW